MPHVYANMNKVNLKYRISLKELNTTRKLRSKTLRSSMFHLVTVNCNPACRENDGVFKGMKPMFSHSYNESVNELILKQDKRKYFFC